MDNIKDGWFMEKNQMWPGQFFSLEVEKILFTKKSAFQDILVFKSKNYGNVLVLDGVVQCTERDEFSYQEMITHVPLSCHPNPKSVLIIGGGDGGVAREVLKHESIERVVQCEIDGDVIEAARRFLPTMSASFDNPRLTLNVGDGLAFMRDQKSSFDVIITDSSDPVGPADTLFQQEYYQLLKSALKPGGIVCSQGECLWLSLALVKKMQTFCKQMYPTVGYYHCAVPTYPGGNIGFIICGLDEKSNFREPLRKFDSKALNLRYYNKDTHRSAFSLPQYAYDVIFGDS